MDERLHLVTGACGFCGSYVVHRLLGENQRVVATDVPRAFEPSSAVYVSSSYWISNKKSKETGFRYRYPDVR